MQRQDEVKVIFLATVTSIESKKNGYKFNGLSNQYTM